EVGVDALPREARVALVRQEDLPDVYFDLCHARSTCLRSSASSARIASSRAASTAGFTNGCALIFPVYAVRLARRTMALYSVALRHFPVFERASLKARLRMVMRSNSLSTTRYRSAVPFSSQSQKGFDGCTIRTRPSRSPHRVRSTLTRRFRRSFCFASAETFNEAMFFLISRW